MTCVKQPNNTVLNGRSGCMNGWKEIKLPVTNYWFMKIFLTSLSSLILWQHHTAWESVSAPIRLVTTVGDRVRALQIIKTLMLAQCYWLFLYSISWAAQEIRQPRPQSFTREKLSFAEGLSFVSVKPFSVVFNLNVCAAQTKAAGFWKIRTLNMQWWLNQLSGWK